MSSLGAHLATANKRTYPAMATRGCLATYGNVSQWRKVMDLFSDVLSTRPGQYVFFNIANIGSGDDPDEFMDFCEGGDPGFGYTGVFEITGRPYFDPTPLEARGDDSNAILEEQFALRVPIEPIGVFPSALEEWRLLDTIDLDTSVWQPRFKKFLNGSKSLTSMTPWEGRRLMTILGDELPNPMKPADLDWEPYPKSGRVLSMEDIQHQGAEGRDLSGPEDGLAGLALEEIPVARHEKEQFRHEKGLEAWWVEHFDAGIDAFEQLTAGTDIIWFSNYVPSTSSGQALDGLALGLKPNGRYRAFPIEMKRAAVNQSNKREVDQLYRYSVWAKQFLSAKVDTTVDDVRPIFLANGLGKTAKKVASDKLYREPYFIDPTFIEYELTEDGSVNLSLNDL